jgi:hypothetical protein
MGEEHLAAQRITAASAACRHHPPARDVGMSAFPLDGARPR